jgi:hypothetical protein
MVGFHWHHEWNTPRLRMAVGDVSLEWASLDTEITRICETCWHRAYPDERGVPRPFDKRQKGLRAFGKSLYVAEPDEFLIWAWFFERIKKANFERDDIAHGIPGKVTNDQGEQYDGLGRRRDRKHAADPHNQTESRLHLNATRSTDHPANPVLNARRQCNAYRVRWIFVVPYGAGGRGGTRSGGGPASQHRHHGVPERR